MSEPAKKYRPLWRALLIALGIYTVVWGAFVGIEAKRFPPFPVYKHIQEQADPLIHLKTGEPFVWEFDAPGADIRWLHLWHLISHPAQKVSVTVENLTSGNTVFDEVVSQGISVEATFSERNQAGDRIRVTYVVQESPIDEFPHLIQALKRSKTPPKWPVDVQGKEDRDHIDYPIFIIRYHTGCEFLLWGWAALPFLAAFLLRNRRHRERPPFLILLTTTCLLVSVTSLDYWFERYEKASGYADPDQYGLYAEHLHRYLTTPDQRDEAVRYFRNYAHSHVPAIPVLLVGYLMLGVPVLPAFVHLNGVLAFTTVLLFFGLMRRGLRLKREISMWSTLMLLSHVIFLKAFAKPSTDIGGMLFVFVCLTFLTERWRSRPKVWMNAGFSIALLAAAWSRPPGLAYLALFCTAAFLIDLYRESKGQALLRKSLAPPSPAWGQAIRAALVYALPILALIGTSYLVFDWKHNLELNYEKSLVFRFNSNLHFFTTSSIITFYSAAIALPFIRGWRERFPFLAIHLGWIVIYTLLLVATHAPFYNRLYLPMVPSVYIIAALGLNFLFEKNRWIFRVIATLLMVGGLYYVLAELNCPFMLPQPWHDLIFF